MQTRVELKQEAKNLLKGHWGKAIGLNILQILPLLFGLFVVVGIVAAIFVTISQSPDGSFVNDFARETGSNGDRTNFVFQYFFFSDPDSFNSRSKLYLVRLVTH
jgi:hypothetical protein